MFDAQPHSQSGSANSAPIHFSPREAEVLPLLLRGQSSKEIARTLDISHRTVDIYRASILAKMRIRKTSQLFFAVQKSIPQLISSI